MDTLERDSLVGELLDPQAGRSADRPVHRAHDRRRVRDPTRPDRPPARLSDLDLRLAGCVLRRNGEIVGTGTGAAVLGSPLNALVWLANTLGAHGVTLEAGHTPPVIGRRDHRPRRASRTARTALRMFT
ncbi:hypothetical protein Aple_072740 [Acrocarpospora pleiomorpha]|uniref:Uncharacterized protein n=1 Tax=Acrocarpospora pleiomorpha TaxID=90975 RepID=A0A5M3XT23_9ACTN|nr:hypothetical protein [Acrocarpospora pleiomorpha]GES24375.1 hypothetical protein Aple_072740 [Acrocarpospora pleiomorpha]